MSRTKEVVVLLRDPKGVVEQAMSGILGIMNELKRQAVSLSEKISRRLPPVIFTTIPVASL